MRVPRVLGLLLGRGMFRVGVQAMSAVLVVVWDPVTFGQYANALGVCLSLSLLCTAAEKAALKVLPRTRLLTPALAGVIVAVSTAPVAVLLTVLVAMLVIAPSSIATIYAGAAALAVSTGHLMTVSGLHRLRGRPALDTIAFSAVGALLLAVTAATWLVGWAPHVHLALAVAGVVTVTVAALAALPREWLPGRRRGGRPIVARLLSTMWLLGVSDLLDALNVTVIYLALALAGRTTESGHLYLVLLGASALCQVAGYLMRVAQPATSRRLRGTGGAAGRRRALELLRRAERMGIGLTAAFAVALLVPATRAPLLAGTTVVLVLLGAAEVVLFLTVAYGGYLLENTDNAILTVTAGAAAAGLCAVVLLAVALVPPVGAAGALAALALAVAVKASVMRRMLLRARPELRAAVRT